MDMENFKQYDLIFVQGFIKWYKGCQKLFFYEIIMLQDQKDDLGFSLEIGYRSLVRLVIVF